jgi:hypothetical protein
MLKRSGKANSLGRDAEEQPEPLRLIKEADRLSAALSEHQERELPEAQEYVETPPGVTLALHRLCVDLERECRTRVSHLRHHVRR